MPASKKHTDKSPDTGYFNRKLKEISSELGARERRNMLQMHNLSERLCKIKTDLDRQLDVIDNSLDAKHAAIEKHR